MANATFKYIEQMLYDYPDYEREIKLRREELMYPRRELDENIGGSSSHDDTGFPERYVISLERDKRLRALEEQQLVIKNCLFELRIDEQRVIKKRYFDRPQTLTWDGVALESGYSKMQCLRIREKLVNNIGNKLGIM